MNRFADPEERDEPPAREELLDAGLAHEESVATATRTRPHIDVPAPPGELSVRDKARWTLQHMEQGVPEIAQGVLNWEDWWGNPDWLTRRLGPSKVGKHHHYEVEDAKSGSKRNTTRAHVLPVAFYSLLVGKIQDRPAGMFRLRRVDGVQEFPTSQYERPTLEVVDVLRRMLEDAADPGPHISSECSRCGWQTSCARDARTSGHLSQVNGIRRDMIEPLRRRGIESLEQLATVEPRTLLGVPYLRGPDVAVRVVAQAKAYADGVPRIVGAPAIPSRSKTELFVDAEGLGESNRDDAFLFGLLVRVRDRVKYEPFLARAEDSWDFPSFARAWRRFARRINSFAADVPMFHYGNYDKQILAGMADAAEAPLVPRPIVDLAPLVRQHAALPCRGSGLKDVAGGLGFQWRDPAATGRSAPFWFEEWASGRLRSARKALLEYNEDDLLATVLVRDWLAKTVNLRPRRRSMSE